MKIMKNLFKETQSITCGVYAEMLNISADFPKNQRLYRALIENGDKPVASVFDDATAFTAVFCREIAKYFTTEKISVMLDANYSQSHYVCDADKDLNLKYISFVYSEQNKRAFQCSFTGTADKIKLDACCSNSKRMREKFQIFESETKFRVFPKSIAYRENLSDVNNIKSVVDEFKKALEIIKRTETSAES